MQGGGVFTVTVEITSGNLSPFDPATKMLHSLSITVSDTVGGSRVLQETLSASVSGTGPWEVEGIAQATLDRRVGVDTFVWAEYSGESTAVLPVGLVDIDTSAQIGFLEAVPVPVAAVSTPLVVSGTLGGSLTTTAVSTITNTTVGYTDQPDNYEVTIETGVSTTEFGAITVASTATAIVQSTAGDDTTWEATGVDTDYPERWVHLRARFKDIDGGAYTNELSAWASQGQVPAATQFYVSSELGMYDYYSDSWNELSWTEIAVASTATLSQVTLQVVGEIDSYNSEATIHLLSPQGTEVLIYGSTLPASSTFDTQEVFTEFAGENPQGNWILWVTDSYGDGGVYLSTDTNITIS
jgi:hypothetical protein